MSDSGEEPTASRETVAPDAAPALHQEPAFAEARRTDGRAHETVGLFRLLVDTVRDYAIFALDPAGHVLTWNKGAQRFKGWDASEIIGEHISRFYPEEDRRAGKPERLLDLAARDGRVEDEGWRVRKDGTRFWADVVITALRAEDGTLVGFGKVTRDLTERRAAEEALRESEERFRLLVTSVRDYAIFMLDPTGHVASWNAGARAIKGYSEADILGQHFSKFYPAEDLAWDKPAMELRVAAEVGRFEDEGWRIRKDGSRFWANVVITALRSPQGELVGYAKVTRDLTERRASEQRTVEDARRMAAMEAANRARSQFLTALSHELRTPLNAIGGYADLLLLQIRGPLTEQQREDLERIRHSQRHLLALINDLLNFSRIEAGKLEYQISSFPVADVFESVRAMIEPQAVTKGVAFEVQSPAGLAVHADRLKVEQIILNLLSNAVKFTERSGGITLGAGSAPDNKVSIAVTDTGVGIDADQLESIFEPFVQLGRSLTTPHEGAGLGLSISRELARAMGGDLAAESKLGKGATFRLTLPAA